ncbi:hypothetical protein B0H13DRAFT_2306784 [Mycena leptocephala]|nr:hypothetical protein B0H13DRAFT_2306784 [Mycena leptocephala]
MEQVNDLINLAQITDEEEMKRLITSYLPAKKREIWWALQEYAAGTSYADFKKAVLKAYPEVKEDLDGTLEELVRLCAENRMIKRSEEGRLKRFGMRYRTLVTKLSKAPAIILNKEACRRYLDALERGFAETLRMVINTRNLIKEDLLQLGGNAPAAAQPNAVDHRKEDPILLDELIKMAERLANKGREEDEPEYKRSDRFPAVKIERRDARIDELGGELSGLRDALIIAQKQSKAAHEELLKAFQNSKSANPPREDVEPRDPGARNGLPATYDQDRQYNRGYGTGYAKIGGWGIYSEREGTCSDSSREYWQRKSAVGQHYNESFYGGASEDEFDTLRDEVRTLRVKLNQVQTRTPPSFNPPAPTMQMQAQVQPYSNQAAPMPTVNMEELGRTIFNMIKLGGAAQDQYIQTRSKSRTVGFADPPEQDF